MPRSIFKWKVCALATACALGVGCALLQVLYHPDPVLSGWRSGYVASNNNELGFRGHPITYAEDDFVILLLGDSNVEGVGCSFERMPEARLEYHLKQLGRKVRVVSVGASGYGQDQELAGLETFFKRYRADLVLLWLTPTNDPWNNLFPTHWPKDGYPKPTYWFDEGGFLRGPTNAMDKPVHESRVAVSRLFARIKSRWVGSGMDKAWESTMPAAYKPIENSGEPPMGDWDRLDQAGRLRDENLENEKTHLALGLTPPSPRFEYAMKLTRSLLREIEGAAISHGSAFSLLLVEPPITKDATSGTYSLRGKLYRYSKNQERLNIHVLTEGFSTLTIKVTEDRWKRSEEDPHLNERANDQVMRDLALEIVKQAP